MQDKVFMSQELNKERNKAKTIPYISGLRPSTKKKHKEPKQAEKKCFKTNHNRYYPKKRTEGEEY